jgi:hypothetical protein
MRAQLPNSLFILLAVMMFYGPPGGMRALGATPSGHDQTAMKLELRSNSFQHEGKIPREFTCEGKNASPQLEWSNAPADTQTFALILQDPDARRERTPTGWFTTCRAHRAGCRKECRNRHR